ncbi:DUF4381 domain-containing protein [Thalassotalea litorea]|uniref:DUF4381 domain-containing protein n=1 Tax=Thalassotalea litorea TaxID=2020715 RepID=UPI0037353917
MDPLAELKDIHLPDAISIWPLAPGWWIIIAIIIGLIVYVANRWRQQLRYLRVKNQGLKFLSGNDSLSSEQTLNTLKWICLHYFERQQVAKLHGETLLRFFLTKLPTDTQPKFKVLAQNAIVDHYRKNQHDIYAPEMHKAAILWCQHVQLPNRNEDATRGGKS